MPDACRVVPAIESDRAGQPGGELEGDGLYGTYVPECMFASPLRHVDHVYCYNLWWEFFLSSSALLARFVLVFAWCFPPLVFDVELTGLLEDPTFSVGVICRFVRGAVNPSELVKNLV